MYNHAGIIIFIGSYYQYKDLRLSSPVLGHFLNDELFVLKRLPDGGGQDKIRDIRRIIF